MPSRALLAVTCCLLVGSSFRPAAAVVVSLPPAKDNTLIQPQIGLPASNSNGQGAIYVGMVGPNGGNTLRRGVLQFDLAAAGIPADATVNSVQLEMSIANAGGSFFSLGNALSLTRLTDDWGEAGSLGTGSGAPAQPGDATWEHRFFGTPGATWTTPGGDLAPAGGSASVILPPGAPPASAVWSSTPELVGDVRSWLLNPAANFGWIVRGRETVENSRTVIEFTSREDPAEALRPRLTIDYSPSQIPGDANGDTFVDRTDLAIVAASYGRETGATFALGDFDNDGRVSTSDLAILQSSLTPPPPPSPSSVAIPEPATCWLALVAALPFLARMRRKF